jgi:hypothetical protein
MSRRHPTDVNIAGSHVGRVISPGHIDCIASAAHRSRASRCGRSWVREPNILANYLRDQPGIGIWPCFDEFFGHLQTVSACATPFARAASTYIA